MGISLQYDYRNCLAAAIGPEHGLTGEELCKFAPVVSKALAEIQAERNEGKHAFLDLPADPGEGYREFIRDDPRFLRPDFDAVAVLGIGGSALGAAALHRAFVFPYQGHYGALGKPRLFVVDNIDPDAFDAFLAEVDFRRTLFLVVSKSGTTAETLAQFQIVRERLIAEKELGDHRRRVLVLTDPGTPLQKAASELGYTTVPLFAAIGGRFAILSAVGVLPAALCGINVKQLLEGAAEMERACRSENFSENPAMQFAAVHYLLHTTRKMPMFVHFAYSERLRGFADWFRQLFAESLGKKRDLQGQDVFVGPTPVPALGVTDQHSQVQLYVEGPFDKIFTILSVGKFSREIPIPPSIPGMSVAKALSGHDLGDLFRAEEQGTREALTVAGRPNGAILFPQINEHVIGEYILLMELSVALLGKLYGIDPYDQPGVEAGKVAAKRILAERRTKGS